MSSIRIVVSFIALCFFTACANIIPPSGGPSDVKTPQLLSTQPQDSLRNKRVTRIELKFDEYVTLADVSKELQVSPTLKLNPTVMAIGKTVIIKIADSLLQENTTYTINMGKAIKDLHESNPYMGKPFIFSTGGWFDSLQLKGSVIDAIKGQRDSSGLLKVLLYDAQLPFDIVVKQKPSYITQTNTKGEFHFRGLPNRKFRIFALKESKDNQQFDNDDELIGFADTVYNPIVDTPAITLSIFQEILDSNHLKTEIKSDEKFGRKAKVSESKRFVPPLDVKTLNYTVMVDTARSDKRTQDINTPIELYVSRKISVVNPQRVLLSLDSNGVEVESKYKNTLDSSMKKLTLSTQWKPNTLYTLRLLKGFIKDSTHADAMPSKYIFRTKSDDDYGKLEVNIPNKYVDKRYLLKVFRDAETVYLSTISTNQILLKRLNSGVYKMSIIEDANGDGDWTTGELKTKRHAELVIPYEGIINMKAGWEHIVDFEPIKTR
ncbi:MAG: Ig-like domain-containing protein [Phycisphaerales bacterium]|nr:Ig-like domain-containing protein [Phycisphaerales bacterium]